MLNWRTTTQIRIRNTSTVDFHDVQVGGSVYGAVLAGETSNYREAELRLRYGAVALVADGRPVSGQTLAMWGRRFTYEIDIIDLEAGRLRISVVRDPAQP